MSTPYTELKILLIHVRENEDVAAHERHCVQDIASLEESQIDAINVGLSPMIDQARIDAADAVIIGGSGHHSAYKDYPFTKPLEKAILTMAQDGKPLLGSCWGHQFIARVLGGEVMHDPANGEVGTHMVTSTEAASQDPLFSVCPQEYLVLMGHHDHVATLPSGAVELAYSERCRNQAFRIEGLPIYGTQFHTELTPDSLLNRLRMYPKYLQDGTGFDELERALKPTPVAEKIMRRFLESLQTL